MKLMFKHLLMSGAAAVVVGCATVAGAADLPTRKAPPAPMVPIVPPYNWTGFYVGATVGGAWGSGSGAITAYRNGVPFASTYVPTSIGSGTSGWEGGGEIGYNYQMGMAVIGVEDDLEWMTNSKSVNYTSASIPALGGPVSTYASARLDWLGTTRARVGIATLPDNRLLLYFTGGLAYGGGSNSINLTGPSGSSWYGSSGTTQVGWTIGGGAEYAITNNVSLKAEYLYYDLGSNTINSTPNNAFATAQGISATEKVTPQGSIARVGVNYKF